VVDAREEVRVVADARRQEQGAGRRLVQQRLQPRAGGRALLAQHGVGQQGGERGAQRPARPRAEREEGVERHRRGRPGGEPRLVRQQRRRGAEVEDHVPDRHAAARRAAPRRGEHAERQVLDREVGMSVGGVDPAPQRRVVGRVHGHRFPVKLFGSPSQQWS
jgi:hypothetical protein